MLDSTTETLTPWRRRLALDFHVLTTLVFRFWTVLAGSATLIILPLCLDKVRLGYHYAFASVLGLQIFFELGMNQIVMQLAAHEIAHLQTTPDGGLAGDCSRVDRLISLAHMLRKWYGIASSAFFLLVGLAGIAFFDRHTDLARSQWVGPWLLIVAATALNLNQSPWLALLEGAGRVGQVARLRIAQSIAGFALTWLALAAGLGLWASPLLSLTTAIATTIWLQDRNGLTQWLRRTPLRENGARIAWRDEVVVYQFRLAISWISGYFIYQLFVPTVFEHQGAVEAGRLGITLAVFNAIQSIGMSWVYGRSPAMSACVSRGETNQLHAIFRQAIRPAMSFTAACCVVFVVGFCVLREVHPAYASRLSSLTVVLCMAGVTLVNSLVFALAVFMRAHKEEPFTYQAATLAVLVLLTAYLASKVSVEMTMKLYLIITCFVSLPWALLLFKRYFKSPIASAALR